MFELGKIYNRRRDIHDPYGGQRQGGISTPTAAPFVFLFTGTTGEQYGYHDGWDDNGVFIYTGEGQTGDMEFIRGNRAIRDHVQNGKDLLLFQSLGKRKGYRFLGSFACGSWEYRDGQDLEGSARRAIVFHLISAEGEHESGLAQPTSEEALEDMKKAAYEAVDTGDQGDPKQAQRRYYERSEDVKRYVLARAGGICECCGQPAPFRRKNTQPFLEPHHVRKLSDGGPDHPRWVGAICPNCHAEIHYGENGDEANRRLAERLGQLEQ